MKKRLLTIGMIFALVLGMPTVVSAEDMCLVTFSENKEFEYENMELKAFEGMAPGESATQMIKLVNRFEEDMDFFLSQETIEEIKNANGASGGSFLYSLSVGTKEDGSDATSLLEKEVGGTAVDGTDLEAFTGIDDLKEFTYIAKLSKGEAAYIFLSLEIDGEGNDNKRTEGEEEDENNLYGYSNFLSTLSFSFRAYDGTKIVVDEPEPTIIDRITEVVKSNPYKGGDTESKIIYTVVMGSGLTLIVVAVVLALRKKKGEQKDE